jgi:hypothetical protein
VDTLGNWTQDLLHRAMQHRADHQQPMTERSMSSDAVPEADAHDQDDPLDRSDESGRPRPRIDDETPEADAYEQSLPVPMDDDDRR